MHGYDKVKWKLSVSNAVWDFKEDQSETLAQSNLYTTFQWHSCELLKIEQMHWTNSPPRYLVSVLYKKAHRSKLWLYKIPTKFLKYLKWKLSSLWDDTVKAFHTVEDPSAVIVKMLLLHTLT